MSSSSASVAVKKIAGLLDKPRARAGRVGDNEQAAIMGLSV
ncbi:MAG: hypothetical protein ABI355_05520 [Solirubrobacteraceae bacterium]